MTRFKEDGRITSDSIRDHRSSRFFRGDFPEVVVEGIALPTAAPPAPATTAANELLILLLLLLLLLLVRATPVPAKIAAEDDGDQILPRLPTLSASEPVSDSSSGASLTRQCSADTTRTSWDAGRCRTWDEVVICVYRGLELLRPFKETPLLESILGLL